MVYGWRMYMVGGWTLLTLKPLKSMAIHPLSWPNTTTYERGNASNISYIAKFYDSGCIFKLKLDGKWRDFMS